MTDRNELLRLIEEMRHLLGGLSTTPAPQTDRILYSIEEAAEILRCSRSHLDRQHREGRIAYKLDGRRRFVHRDELESYAANLPSE